MALADVIEMYGQAWRGDWNDFDGRTLRDATEVIADWLRNPERYPGDDGAAYTLGMCITGGEGHWSDYCDSYHPGEAGIYG